MKTRTEKDYVVPTTPLEIIEAGGTNCGNCAHWRTVNTDGIVERCPSCMDDAWDIYWAPEQQIP